MAFWNIFCKNRTKTTESGVKIIEKEPIVWYKVRRFDELTYYSFSTVDAILEAYPDMTRKGVEKVLSGKQKTHLCYIIEKETL